MGAPPARQVRVAQQPWCLLSRLMIRRQRGAHEACVKEQRNPEGISAVRAVCGATAVCGQVGRLRLDDGSTMTTQTET